MGEIIGWLLLIAIAGTIIFYVTWILLALVARIFSVILVYWGLTFLLALLAGVIAGVALPARVLSGRGKAPLRQLTPADLVDGTVIKRKPRSPNAEYGWDSAWPNYMPYQALEDARAVRLEAVRHVGIFWTWFTSKMPGGKGASTGSGTARFLTSLGRSIPKVLWTALVLPAFLGYFLGAWASTLVWFVVMTILGVVVTLGQQVGLGLYTLFDVGDRRRLRASVKCPDCYGESHLPGYRCSNPSCPVVHWTMLPGPLGLVTRRCSCGIQLPNTVSSAARKLIPVCPYCRKDLVAGSGARHTLQLALIGSIGAGKTRLLDAMLIELARTLDDIGGSIAPLNPAADQYFQQASARRQQAAPTAKTQHERPVGLPFLVRKDKIGVELQVMDAAGEAFANWEETAKLRYLDTADGIVLVLDPLALPEIHDHLRRSQYANSILLATGDQEESYGAAIDRLRAESIPLEKRGLAVVLTKGDVLTKLPVAAAIDLSDSVSIRQWLLDNGSDLMVRRFEKDFRDVRYFVVDSMLKRDSHTPLNPWWVIDWLLTEAKSPINLGQYVKAPEPEAVKEGTP
jgi:hypothetical protein